MTAPQRFLLCHVCYLQTSQGCLSDFIFHFLYRDIIPSPVTVRLDNCSLQNLQIYSYATSLFNYKKALIFLTSKTNQNL
jgi:hypothetical protein